MKEPTIKINEGETPTEAVTREARKVVDVTDSLGRVLRVRKMNALHKLDLAKAVGSELVANEAVINPCALAYSCIQIDGEEIYPPRNYDELRVLVGRLDDEGLECIGKAHVENFGVALQADPAGDLKNS